MIHRHAQLINLDNQAIRERFDISLVLIYRVHGL
nr:MAG TPA: hypothetical protein [Caudoviricetes sp.]DAQ33386.1 MAG TPA: hypothetical protein [Caudoviricetes sp.]